MSYPIVQMGFALQAEPVIERGWEGIYKNGMLISSIWSNGFSFAQLQDSASILVARENSLLRQLLLLILLQSLFPSIS